MLALLPLVLGPASFLGTQDEAPPSEREQISRAMRTIKARGATDEERDLAMAELLFLGSDGPRSLGSWIESSLKSRGKRGAKEEARLLSELERRGAEVIRQRLKGKAEREVDELRDLLRRHYRDAQLTKETIQAECDPAVARLTELLTIGAQEVWGADEQLQLDWESLLDDRDRDFVLLETWYAAQAALLSIPGSGERAARRMKEPTWPQLDAEDLLDEADRIAQLAIPMSKSDRRAFDQNHAVPVAQGDSPAEGEIGAEEKLGVRFLNLRRVLLGLPAQSLDLKLSLASRGHSRDMAEHGFFSHDSPLKGKETPWARAALAGTTASSENIAVGSSTGEGAILQWWYSPGHHRNMMGGGSRSGLGRFGRHWTQLFGG